ncbi:MAG: DNA primase [Patescibacteria group bacterium]
MSQVQQVKDATDIIQVIGERIKLQRSGSSYKAPCPFHSEKTPSFFVSEQLQRYRCFGCGETGDALDFLQKYEAMSFAEALKYLADQAGIQLAEFQKTNDDELRERLLAILNLAKEYYHYLLTIHSIGEQARKYLKERAISQESIQLFNLGYSMTSWDGLVKYLHHKKKFPLEEIEQTGLIIKGRGGRYYDRFRGRVMFPLKDHRGRVVGFSGRLLDKVAKEAKYINTPETKLYHKSKMLFGYKELLSEIKKKEAVIVVEGEFDVISSSQNHVNNIVAIKGSALTQEQVKLISRIAKKILLCLDADEAGIKATKRAIEVVGDTDIELRVIDLSSLEGGAKDVDELARSTPKVWRELENQSISVYEFLLRFSLRKNDPERPEGKREIIKEVGPVFAEITHAVEKDFYIKKLAETLKVKSELIKQDLQKIKQNLPLESAREPISTQRNLPSRRQSLERYLIFLLFESNKFSEKIKLINDFAWQTPGLFELIKHFSSAEFKNKLDLKKATQGLAEDLKQLVFDVVYDPKFISLKEQIDFEVEWLNTWLILRNESARASIKLLQAEIKELDRKAEKTEQEELEFNNLLKKIAHYQQILRSVNT